MTDSTPTDTTFAALIAAEILEIGDGYRAKNDELGGDGPIFLRAGHVRDTHIDFQGVERFRRDRTPAVASKMSRPGDTIITTKGNSTGRTSYVGDGMPGFVYSPHLSYWRSRDPRQLDPLFLRYWARGGEFQNQLTGMKVSTDMAPYLSLADQRRLRITLPPRAEQPAIGCLLGALDDKIALNRRMNGTLEATAAALFRSWFVDFDPVVAKAEGRRAPGVPDAVHEVMPSALTDHDGELVPIGWQLGRAGQLIDIVRAGVNPGDTRDDVFDHYSIPAFDDGMLPVREPGANIKSGKFRVENGAVLVSKLNPHTPRVWWPAPPVGARSVCSTEFLVCMPHRAVPREFVYALFRSEAFTETLALFVTGTSNSHQRAKPEDLLRVSIVRPSEPCMRGYAQVVGPVLERSRANLLESASLASLRDTLLPQLLSGAVRLRAAERAVAAAV